jgi:glycerol uptake facilitator protein
MQARLFGEFMGTLVLILLGNGVVAGTLLKKSKGESAGWVAITVGWGLAVMCGVLTAVACGSVDAHLNPAVTLAFAVSSGDFSKIAYYVPAQLLGAIGGAFLVWIFYSRTGKSPDRSEAGLFRDRPGHTPPAANLVSEAVGTFVLIVVIAAITSGVGNLSPSGALASGFGPYLVECWYGPLDFPSAARRGMRLIQRATWARIAHAILPISGKGGSDWGYAVVPVIGPLLGAVAGHVRYWFIS